MENIRILNFKHEPHDVGFKVWLKCKFYFTAVCISNFSAFFRAMKTKGMMFRYTWVYSKEDTMVHIRRAVVTS